VEGTHELVDAAVQTALPVAAGLDVYKVAPLRGNGPQLIDPVDYPPRVASVDPNVGRCENPATVR
jgi:hypothetical protein